MKAAGIVCPCPASKLAPYLGRRDSLCGPKRPQRAGRLLKRSLQRIENGNYSSHFVASVCKSLCERCESGFSKYRS